jgi:hypothetical protein
MAPAALTCARALAMAVPELLIAVTTSDVDADAGIDATVAALDRLARLRLFGAPHRAPPAGAIRLDAATARLLTSEPTFEREGIVYVVGRG